MTRIFTLTCLIAMLAMVGGCDTQPRISYSAPADVNDDFARGVNRPPTAETLFRMARLLEGQNKDDQAAAVYRNTIDRYPQYVPAYVGFSALQVRQGKVVAAIATLEKAREISPEDPVVLNDLGMCWMLRGEHETALEHFTQASALDPDDARYRANMALATGMMGRYDEAYALYEQIMRPARAHYNLSVVAEARNDMAKADEEFAKAKALDSTIERKPRPRK